MRTNYNPTNSATGIEDIATGRNRLRNARSVERLYERTKKYFRYDTKGNLQPGINHLGFENGKEYSILTWDTETTGLSSEAQVRDISLVRRTVTVGADGKAVTTKVEPVMTKRFASDLMDIAGYLKEGSSVPLSEATILTELGEDASPEIIARAKAAFKDRW